MTSFLPDKKPSMLDLSPRPLREESSPLPMWLLLAVATLVVVLMAAGMLGSGEKREVNTTREAKP